MKVIYIYEKLLPEAEQDLTGIDRKVMAQIDLFKLEGWDCSLVAPAKGTGVQKLLQAVPFASDNAHWEDIDASMRSQVFYIRRPLYCSKQFVVLLNNLRCNNPDSLFLFEIPTYPYDGELTNKKYFSVLLKDIIHRRSLRKYIDAVIDLSGEDCIFGIRTIQMCNGIDLSGLKVRKSDGLGDDSEISFICVAGFSEWHGIDRLLEGLACYYGIGSVKSREVNLHLVGDGPELMRLFALTKSLGIEQHVSFYGQCGREEMDVVYDQCSMAIECLGMHRRTAGAVSSSLKSREYLAKGIPFIHSEPIDVFQEEPVDFCLRVPADESPIDIERIIEFHDELYAREPEEQLIARIRDYAERNVSMEKGMENVIEYIKENCGE